MLFSSRQPFGHFATISAIQFTELYEYCLTLGGKCLSLPSFQVFHTSEHEEIKSVAADEFIILQSFCIVSCVVRCTNSCTPVGCWTVGSPPRPFITVRWWDGPSSGRRSRTLFWQGKWLRLVWVPERSYWCVLCQNGGRVFFSCSCQTGWGARRLSTVKLASVDLYRNQTGSETYGLDI